ncbi:tetratricopeptide repeat protein [Microlunatus speluncae]|uniref:tetratricopeptide repeat protein n=1 Tax=Microlunatus speluncae TaxID=2594267 RepID=UPI0012667665|nr:tetratricopeptide repeat protein [Microlunatus speluncae]
MNPMGLAITVRKIKLDGVRSEHTATLIESNAEGRWLFSPAGTVVTRSDAEPYRQPADGVQFFPHGQWFAAWHFAPAMTPTDPIWTRPWLAIDINEPARFDDESGGITFLDLELDLWCAADGAEIVDQEDLAEVERRGLITTETAARVRRTAANLAAALHQDYRSAFDGVGWRLLEQARDPIPGGPGWQHNALTLRPVITDIDDFRAEFTADPCADAIEALWSGRPAEAAAHLDAMLITDPGSVRLRALRADCDRDLGRVDAAIETYRQLLAETTGTPREGTVHQHLGKALFAAGRYGEAAECFDRAATSRRGGDPASLTSALRSRDRARQLG